MNGRPPALILELSDLVHIWRRFVPESSFLQEATAAGPSHRAVVAGAERRRAILITLSQAAEMVGDYLVHKIRGRSLAIYRRASACARERGIIIADTKFEFGVGRSGGGPTDVLLIDEVLTPDSSRFRDMAAYQPGRIQDSFDKQPLRDYLRALGRNRESPAPELPPAIAAQTREKYLEAYRRLAAKELATSG